MNKAKWCGAWMMVCIGLSAWNADQAHARWYKGNTHCHTALSSDSDNDPEDFFAWYKNNDYDFVIPTDHNRYNTLESLQALRARDEDSGQIVPIMDETFLLIPGEELTTSAHHINGIDLPARVAPASTISAAFELIWSNGAVPQLNHPEYNSLQARGIIEEISELNGPMLLEIFNSHPLVVTRSGMSSEDIWDGILSAGKLVWGVAVDDAHTMPGGHTPPGGGFIYVDADDLRASSIVNALEEGNFYASTGATLESFTWTSSLYEIDAPGAEQITFIGQDGRILSQVQGEFATYDFQPGDRYVRARIRSAQGFAWTQPVFVGELPSNLSPTAQIEVSIARGPAPLRVTFDGRGSSDPDGEIVTWRWDFGDQSTGRGQVITHAYDTPGTYTAELTVFDEQGELGRTTVRIEALAPGEEPDDPDMGTPDTGTPDTGTPDTGTPDPADTGTHNNDEPDASQDTPQPDLGEDEEPAPPANNITQTSQEEGCAQTTPSRPVNPWSVLISTGLGLFLFMKRRRH